MCSQYWNLDADIKCPKCKSNKVDFLQTHFNGEIMSCRNTYKIGEKVKELKGVKNLILDGRNNDFDAECLSCGLSFSVGAKIEDEKVVKVYVIDIDEKFDEGYIDKDGVLYPVEGFIPKALK